jgi:hydroxymethyl cephem carbamoyltransferase
MLILALNPGHDGAIAAINDGKLEFCLEAEKDSFMRHALVNPTTLLLATEQLDAVPDVIALSGWVKEGWGLGKMWIGAGYAGSRAMEERTVNFMGKRATLFTSSHERCHIAMAVGMAPRDDAPLRAVLCYEGDIGSFYLLDSNMEIVKEIPVLFQPGGRYAFLFALSDPLIADSGHYPRLDDAGKLMALAAYGNPEIADDKIKETVERILTIDSIWPAPKHAFRDSPVYNAEPTGDATKIAAALLTKRMFEIFAEAAQTHLPAGIPLYISGGCGLNCDWNSMWRELGHFSSVFVPPCTNDSGSAIGTGIDAQISVTGDPFIDWDVYCGRDFEWDSEPDPNVWKERPLDYAALSKAIGQEHRVVGWVQGRWELGPRALGARSILADPFNPFMKERLNVIKQREDYRPIAPVCRQEDVGKLYDRDHPDPYMLYFRLAKDWNLAAVTHVDKSARVQTVTEQTSKPLYELLTAFAKDHGVGVLCNTSLNFKGRGFINRTSDLTRYGERHGLDDLVVGDRWFERVDGARRRAGAQG